MTYDTCFYHRGCSDGITAAWCIRLKHPDIKFVGINPSDDNVGLEDYEEKRVIFVDVCPGEKLLDAMMVETETITILDHHKTNEEFLAEYSDEKLSVIFDMDRSGCQIAWDFMYPGVHRPWFVDYVGDRDLWKFELPDSKLINISLYELGYNTFEKLDELYDKKGEKYKIMDELLKYGKMQNDFNQKLIQKSIKKAYKAQCEVDGEEYTVWVATIISSLKSELGNDLANTFFEDGSLPDFVAIYEYDLANNEWYMSLRSISTDVAEVAKHFGGGGHKFAAGFKTNECLADLFTCLSNE